MTVFALVHPISSWAEAFTSAEISDLQNAIVLTIAKNPSSAYDLVRLARLKAEFSNELTNGDIGSPGMNYSVLDNRNQTMAANSCLADLTVGLWLDLVDASESKGDSEDRDQRLSRVSNGNRYPSLAATAHSAGFGSSGWLWRQALASAGGNPNLAMTALSVWTHDNTMISFKLPSVGLLSQKTQSRLSARRDKYNAYSAGYGDLIMPRGDSLELPSITLPQEMFVPGSLGQGVDISPELKAKIIRIQAPTTGAQGLPAKYYHVTGGAVSGCSLRQRGLTEPVIITIQQKIAEIYRSRRACMDIATSFQAYSRSQQSYQAVGERQGFAEYLSANIERLLASRQCESDDDSDPLCFLVTRSYNSLSSFTDEYSDDKPVTHEAVLKKVSRIVERWKASMVFAQVGQSQGHHVNESCTDGTWIYSALKAAAARTEISAECKAVGFASKAECDKSKQIIDSWSVDFEWTIEQQAEGARFGAKACSPVELSELERQCLNQRQQAVGKQRP